MGYFDNMTENVDRFWIYLKCGMKLISKLKYILYILRFYVHKGFICFFLNVAVLVPLV